MTCKWCGKKVFYFTCDCGSKVFFDELGTWKLHRCSGWLKLEFGSEIVSLEKFYGKPVVSKLAEYNQRRRAALNQNSLSDRVEKFIDKSCIVKVQKEANKPLGSKESSHPIVRQEPYNNLITYEDGLVRDINIGIDLLKKLRIPETPIGLAALGEFAKARFVQITIHTGGLEADSRDSFTFLLKEKIYKRLGLITGDFVSVKLRGVQILNRDPFWVCEEIHTAFS